MYLKYYLYLKPKFEFLRYIIRKYTISNLLLFSLEPYIGSVSINHPFVRMSFKEIVFRVRIENEKSIKFCAGNE